MFLLLAVIYAAFISLGLPDSLLGSTWPSMYGGLGVPIASAGIVSMIISGGTILSSLLSDRLIKRFGTGAVTAASVAMTALALLGFSFSGDFYLLCLFAVPLGLGAGSIDTALNNFVAVHYKAMHMSWLHCFWGIGASLGPVIMAFCLKNFDSWPLGYRTIGVLQVLLTAVLLFSMPLWRKAQATEKQTEAIKTKSLSIGKLIKLPGAKAVMLAFFTYCAIEATVGLWGSSFLVKVHEIPEETATFWISLYYTGIMAGRFFSGFLTLKLRHKQMIVLGEALIAAGIVILLLPVGGYFLLAGLFFIGLGCAPIFPSLIHETPNNFGVAHSQAMMGLEMASAYVGTTLMPPLFGLIAAHISYRLLPYFLVLFLIVMIFMVEVLFRKTMKKEDQNA